MSDCWRRAKRVPLLHYSEGEGNVKGNGMHLASPPPKTRCTSKMAHWIKMLQGEEEPVVGLEQVRPDFTSDPGRPQILSNWAGRNDWRERN